MDLKSKKQIRRVKANCRERNRMNGLNKAMDTLRSTIPLINSNNQKLSKIETLRLARNYIDVLNRILCTEKEPITLLEYAQILSQGMSQTTTNLIASHLKIQPRTLIMAQRNLAMLNNNMDIAYSSSSSASSFSSYSGQSYLEDYDMRINNEVSQQNKQIFNRNESIPQSTLINFLNR